jgi:hypothetical protein
LKIFQKNEKIFLIFSGFIQAPNEHANDSPVLGRFSTKYVFARLCEGKCKLERTSSNVLSKCADFTPVSRHAF